MLETRTTFPACSLAARFTWRFFLASLSRTPNTTGGKPPVCGGGRQHLPRDSGGAAQRGWEDRDEGSGNGKNGGDEGGGGERGGRLALRLLGRSRLEGRDGGRYL